MLLCGLVLLPSLTEDEGIGVLDEIRPLRDSEVEQNDAAIAREGAVQINNPGTSVSLRAELKTACYYLRHRARRLQGTIFQLRNLVSLRR